MLSSYKINRFTCNYETDHELGGNPLKGIVSWDFDGLLMILSYSLVVRHVLLHIHILFYLILCFHAKILSLRMMLIWAIFARNRLLFRMKSACTRLRVANSSWKNHKWNLNMKHKKRMWCGTCLYDKITKLDLIKN
jgi:hypothetical protein